MAETREPNWDNDMIAEMLEPIVRGIKNGTIDIVRYRATKEVEDCRSDKRFEFEYRFIKKEIASSTEKNTKNFPKPAGVPAQ